MQHPTLPSNISTNSKQFTQIGYIQSLTKFTAPKANDYSIVYYDHIIIRPIEDNCLNNDPFANNQLTENFSSRPQHLHPQNLK